MAEEVAPAAVAEPAQGAKKAAPPSRRSILMRIGLLLGILAVVFVLILPRVVDYGSVLDALENVEPEPDHGDEMPLLSAGLEPAPTRRSLWARMLVSLDRKVLPGRALAALKTSIHALRDGQAAGTPATIDVAAFKERFGLSRKFAIPLLEWLDRERVTRRMGDRRVLI